MALPKILTTLGAVSGLASLTWFYWYTNGRPLAWIKFRLGFGKDVRELARRLNVEVDPLRSLTPTYREHQIRKKHGGWRRLSIPDDATKAMQRRILRRLLGRLKAHPAAMAYERGLSIAHNARPHVGKAVVVKLDLVDFFPSLTAQRCDRYFRFIGWNPEAAALLTRLCTHEDRLPQGAPTSPRISNLLMLAFDERIRRYVARRRGVYTRYADDITISFPKDYPRHIRGVIQFVERTARSFGLVVHRAKKRLVLRRHQQQRVTGLVVNEKAQLPRSVRRKLRAAAHHLLNNRPATWTQQQLQGWRALEAMVRRHATGETPPGPDASERPQ